MDGDLVIESLEDLYEDAPCGYIFTTPDGTLTRVNRTFLDWTGYARSELLTRRIQDLLTVPGKMFYENQYAPLLRMQGSVKEVAFDLRLKDGDRLPVLMNSTLRTDANGEPVLIASTIFDASDRRRYEHELRVAREQAEQLAAIVTSANDAIVRLTPAGIVQTWNTGAERLFGYQAQSIVGQDIWQLLSSLRHVVEQAEISGELRAGRSVYLDSIARHPDGRDIAVSIGLVPHLGLLGELDGLSAIIRDISDRRALERLQQEFLAMTSHELRQPLANIKGQAQLMRRRSTYSERALDMIVEQTNRLGRLIDDLLLASLIEADRFDVRLEPIDLITEVRSAVEQIESHNREITLDAPTDAIVVLGDRQRLGQVFGNLLTNAIKYSASGTEVVVRVRTDGDLAVVDFIDHGVGIPPESIGQLFSRFYRHEASAEHVSGLGLGLYITRRIVQAHGGSIDVESVVGVGSTFSVSLPIHTPLSP